MIKPIVGSASPGLMSGMSPTSTVANSTQWMTIEIKARTAEAAASADMPEMALPDFETNFAGSFSGPSSKPSLLGTRPSRISL